ncbi:MAG: hypothetical protein P1U57_07215, partial [Oleibacter sp.]|nr:hypothetical protein [Thalassolituus sp.]
LSMVNLSEGDRAAQNATEEFANQIQGAFGQYREEAVFQNIDLGVAWFPAEWRLLNYVDYQEAVASSLYSVEELDKIDKNPWQPYLGRLSAAIAFPDGVEIRLSIEDQVIDPNDLFDQEKGALPAILFLSSDEYTPFDILLTHEEDAGVNVLVTGDGFGPVSVVSERVDER